MRKAVFALLLLCAACQQETPAPAQPEPPPAPVRTLRIGKIPYLNARGLIRKYEPLLERLAAPLGVDRVEMVLAPDYSAVLGRLRGGEIDIAWLGTMSYLRDGQRNDLRPVVRPVWEGRSGYRGIIVSRRDSGLERLEQLRGKSMAFVEPASASGWVFPAALMRRRGIDPSKDLGNQAFLGSHDAVLLAVFLGRFDAGAAYETGYLALKDPAQMKELRVLARTELIPSEPLVALRSTSDAQIRAWQKAFLAVGLHSLPGPDGGTHALVEGLTGFEVTDTTPYDALAKLLGPGETPTP